MRWRDDLNLIHNRKLRRDIEFFANSVYKLIKVFNILLYYIVFIDEMYAFISLIAPAIELKAFITIWPSSF